jgi:hypothetical protein
VGRDSLVSISSGYGWTVESLCGRNFPHPSIPALVPTQHPLQWVPVLFPEGKAAETWCWLPTPSCTEVKESVELYLSPVSLSGPSWPVLGWTLPFSLPYLIRQLTLELRIAIQEGPTFYVGLVAIILVLWMQIDLRKQHKTRRYHTAFPSSRIAEDERSFKACISQVFVFVCRKRFYVELCFRNSCFRETPVYHHVISEVWLLL